MAQGTPLPARAAAALLLLALVVGVNRLFAPAEAPLGPRARLWIDGMVDRPGLYSLRPETPDAVALRAAGPRVAVVRDLAGAPVARAYSLYLDREGRAYRSEKFGP